MRFICLLLLHSLEFGLLYVNFSISALDNTIGELNARNRLGGGGLFDMSTTYDSPSTGRDVPVIGQQLVQDSSSEQDDQSSCLVSSLFHLPIFANDASLR